MAFTTSFCCPQVAKNVITDLKLFKFNTFCHQFKYVCRNELKLTGVGRCKRVLVLCGNLKLLGARQQVKDPNTDSPDRVEAFSDLLTKLRYISLQAGRCRVRFASCRLDGIRFSEGRQAQVPCSRTQG